MESKIILSWNNVHPHKVYAKALAKSLIYFDNTHHTWVVYSHSFCKSILLNPNAQIPEPVWNELLNDKANLLISKLVRLSNNEQHLEARRAAELVYKTMQPVSLSDLVQSLIKEDEYFDWVDTVCKRLPVLVLLKGFGCTNEERDYVINHIETIVKLLSPQKTNEEIDSINGIMDDLFSLSEELIARSGCFESIESDKEKWIQLYICNLIGLLIQSYDAGWGLLCNSLMWFNKQSRHVNLKEQNINYFKNVVVETLRFDPPVHFTKRIVAADISIGGQTIKVGENVLLILGAANLDPQIFADPLIFEPLRTNNSDHLTFGAGGHACLAKYLMINMAAEVCRYLYTNYNMVEIHTQSVEYERKMNVRLVKKLLISLNN